MPMDSATISAMSALAGSAIGALASVTTTWFTQNSRSREQRLKQEAARRERLFSDFVDRASQTYAEGIVQESLEDPARLVPLYASINKLRLFATPETVQAAEVVLDAVFEIYRAPDSVLKARSSNVAAHDILRSFAESCRSELEHLR